MNVMVTGAAGYIGSHAVKRLAEGGFGVLAVDNLHRGHRQAVAEGVIFEQADLHETDRLAQLMDQHQVKAVIHFAALAFVGESVEQPLKYYENNTAGTLSLLKAMERAGVKRLVFSSTCATYGEPEQMPIREDMPQQPINPYGWSKLFVERMLIDYAAANPGFAFGALRYFNVAGCASDGSIGEDHDPETHLIPVILQAALGQRDKVKIFGQDYPTPDGTCVRDYIHVEDLVDAHVVVMDALADGDQRFYNLGIGQGYSVRQIIDAVKRVTGQDFPVEEAPRRPGDPPELWADPSKIQNELSWRPKITDIDQIIATAWNWFSKHPSGYETPAQAQR